MREELYIHEFCVWLLEGWKPEFQFLCLYSQHNLLSASNIDDTPSVMEKVRISINQCRVSDRLDFVRRRVLSENNFFPIE